MEKSFNVQVTVGNLPVYVEKKYGWFLKHKCSVHGGKEMADKFKRKMVDACRELDPKPEKIDWFNDEFESEYSHKGFYGSCELLFLISASSPYDAVVKTNDIVKTQIEPIVEKLKAKIIDIRVSECFIYDT